MEKALVEGPYLCGNQLSLADIHLAPMIGYFVLADQGRALLQKHRRVSHWWSEFSARAAFVATRPRLP
ncbi:MULTISPECIES: glutathione S-transferase C-terminal domain-containing protein [unclassified Bradyrhizobium]|uniref:glutathione S-transferase C-terminal domain-containing protein n=1 Tax=unclassified Bradyrhizobium TaxID=2631580 RepID=UPI001FFBE270|nr:MULTISPECIES: glutathione S-transferase C-terminal domain-containing protein [unclassified Bradyrhizobium]